MSKLAKPIIFSTPMVLAILEDWKIQTRRVIRFPNKLRPHWYHGPNEEGLHEFMFGEIDPINRMAIDWTEAVKAPYKTGDVLWVRETFTQIRNIETGHIDTFYAAEQKDYDTVSTTYLCDDDGFETDRTIPWKPSIHMPREAARLFLRVTDVRVEQLQDITEFDAIKEGFPGEECHHFGRGACEDCNGTGWIEPPSVEFMMEWENLNAKRGLGWDVNPWVWVVEFERVEGEG